MLFHRLYQCRDERHPPRPSAVPEPMPLVLICLGLFGIAFITKRKISA
ncbi:PEP-CTERM sorting domain-containing protein [Ferrovum myxofaciens]